LKAQLGKPKTVANFGPPRRPAWQGRIPSTCLPVAASVRESEIRKAGLRLMHEYLT